MRYSVEVAQIDFFAKNRLIPFEGMLSNTELTALETAQLPPSCRNFWKKSTLGKKLLLNRSRAQAASQLFQEKPLRIAYDDLIIGTGKPPIPGHIALNDISAVQGIVGAALINLGCTVDSPLPEKLGDTTFFAPDALLPLDYIYAEGTRFLLVVYCNKTPIFRHCPRDPSVSTLRAEGYSYGDRLSEDTSPLAYSGG
jgi:hypothetical protein